MKRLFIILLILGTAAAGYYAWQVGWLDQALGQALQALPPAAAPAAIPTAPPVKASRLVVAEAKVMPIRYATLSLQTGGSVAQVLVSEGDRVEAGQIILRLESRELELSIAQADANLASAAARLGQLKRGPTPADLAAAQQAVAAAQAGYDHLLTPDPDEMTILKSDSDKAKVLLDQAQFAYDRIGGDTNPAAGGTVQRQNLQIAWVDYQKALAAYNLKLHPGHAQTEQALSAIASAKSQLARLQPAAEELAAAQAALEGAQAARDLAAERLAKARLLAPFAGTLAILDARVGETVAAGAPLARLANLGGLQFETTDLTELAVGRVKVGDAATVTVDALPGVEFPGKVSRIRSYGENRQGDIVYTVIVQPDRQDDRLRWNMTAAVSIQGR
jgi:multidrug efflux pump subunit AcrA (membrane-fusion protein)